MNIIKESAKFIGWLSGSTVGIGAIFYACGYIAIQTHSHSLGIKSILEYEPKYYLITGANFLIVIIYYILEISSLFVACLLIFFLFHFLITHGKSRKHISFRNRLDNLNTRWPWLWKTLVFILLLVFFFYFANELKKDSSTLKISNLLFLNSGDLLPSSGQEKTILEQENSENGKLEEKTSQEKGIEDVTKSIIEGDRKHLEKEYRYVVLKALGLVLLLLLAFRTIRTWRLNVLLLSPFIVMFVMYIALLAMLYGVLLKQTEISPIELDSANGNISCGSEYLYLLHKTGQEFILWNSTKKKVLWLSRNMIKSAVIGQSRPLFQTINQEQVGGKTDD